VRRLAAIALCVVPLVAAGCGSSGASDSGQSPLDNALGYMPKSAPIVFTLDTDLGDSQWQSLTTNAQKFPFSGQVTKSLKTAISQSGLDYDKDVKPLLGNPFVIAIPTVQTTLSGNSQAVGAVEVKDKGKLSDLLSGDKDVTKDGSANGATLYKATSGGTEFAQKDDVFLVADSKQQLTAALEQRERDDRLTEDTFNSNLSGLPSEALVKGYVDAGALLGGSPAAATARKVKWVAALKTTGFTLSSQSDGISIDFNARTDPSQLTEADLPLASGDDSPPVAVKPGEIGVGIRGLDQTERFIENVAQVVSPGSFSNFAQAKKTLSKRLGLDIDKDVLAQLSGNVAAAFDISGHYAARAEPKDPAAFEKTLEQFAKVATKFASGAGLQGAKLTKVGNLYKLTGSNGKTIYYGMVGKVFALSNSPSRLASIAAQTPQAVPGAKGALTVNADIGELVSQIIAQAAGGGLGGAFGGSLATAPLGHLVGWVNSSTSGLQGHYKLEIK
jgi:hypothetical protein